MKLEHFALNVTEPQKVAAWYAEHLGMTIVKAQQEAPFMHFLADESGDVMIELYHNPPNEVPEYAQMNPLIVHLAFVTEEPEQDMKRLILAGASKVDEKHLPDGSHLVMMRDPWGLALQLCKRGNPMLRCQQQT